MWERKSSDGELSDLLGLDIVGTQQMFDAFVASMPRSRYATTPQKEYVEQSVDQGYASAFAQAKRAVDGYIEEHGSSNVFTAKRAPSFSYAVSVNGMTVEMYLGESLEELQHQTRSGRRWYK